MSAEMYSDIVFLGDCLVPEVCTERMGMMPSKSYRKGQRYGPLLRIKDTGAWWLTTTRCTCDDIMIENERSFGILRPHADTIATLKADYQLELHVCAVVEMCTLPYPRLYWPSNFFETLVTLHIDDYDVDWYDLEPEKRQSRDPVDTRARAWIESGEGDGRIADTGWLPTAYLEELMIKCLDRFGYDVALPETDIMHVDIEVHNDERVVIGFSRQMMKRLNTLNLGLDIDWKRI